jgi:hypothetical protein
LVVGNSTGYYHTITTTTAPIVIIKEISLVKTITILKTGSHYSVGIVYETSSEFFKCYKREAIVANYVLWIHYYSWYSNVRVFLVKQWTKHHLDNKCQVYNYYWIAEGSLQSIHRCQMSKGRKYILYNRNRNKI